MIKATAKPVIMRCQQGINSNYQNNTKRYFQILPPQPLKPHQNDAVLFYADIKTLKGLKPLSAYSAKQNTDPFRIVLKGRCFYFCYAYLPSAILPIASACIIASYSSTGCTSPASSLIASRIIALTSSGKLANRSITLF